jgi:hypothetical protein
VPASTNRMPKRSNFTLRSIMYLIYAAKSVLQIAQVAVAVAQVLAHRLLRLRLSLGPFC